MNKENLNSADETSADETQKVRSNWERYQYGKDRGHSFYVDTAALNEDYYFGGGLQWTDEDRDFLEAAGRPVIENNFIWPAVNTAIGMQLQSRVDIAFKPRRDGATEETAKILGKVVMQVTDDIKFRWLESQVFADGLIQQRGFLEFRVDFDTNMQGDVICDDLDALDVIPDPDAQSYDPAKWQDVIIVKWMTIDDISQLYGQKKADLVEEVSAGVLNSDIDDDLRDRSSFGDKDSSVYRDDFTEESGIKRVLVIDRQSKRLEMQKVLISPEGDIIPAASMQPDQLLDAETMGYYTTKRMAPRIRWTVTTADILLHDDWSPYRTYTVIPYFPYFRRGRTRGMVDNIRSPQEFNNKLHSQVLHILNTTANSGYLVEQNSLTNMETADLKDVGSQSGIVIEYMKGAQKPEKIQQNQLPQGHDRLIDRTENSIKNISGISDALQGLNGREVSGKAIQSKQYSGQTQLGGPLDNLAKTRHYVGIKILELIQDFYTEERIITITDDSDISNIQHIPMAINEITPEGQVLNDLTIGEYDVVVTDQPTQATFQDNQFTQAMEMKDKGIQIPDISIIEMSSLTKKHQIAEQLANQAEDADPEAEAKADETAASAELKRAMVKKTEAETVNKGVDAQYSAMQAAGVITQTPATAPLADQLLRSAGYIDNDAAPIVPNYDGAAQLTEGAPQQGLPPNTNPTTPVPVPEPGSPTTGSNAGIETQRIEPTPGG